MESAPPDREPEERRASEDDAEAARCPTSSEEQEGRSLGPTGLVGYLGQQFPQQCFSQQHGSHDSIDFLLPGDDERTRGTARVELARQMSETLVEIGHLVKAAAQLDSLLLDGGAQVLGHLTAAPGRAHVGQGGRLVEPQVERAKPDQQPQPGEVGIGVVTVAVLAAVGAWQKPLLLGAEMPLFPESGCDAGYLKAPATSGQSSWARHFWSGLAPGEVEELEATLHRLSPDPALG